MLVRMRRCIRCRLCSSLSLEIFNLPFLKKEIEENATDNAKNTFVLVIGDQSMLETLTLNRPTYKKAIELLSIY